MRLRGKSGKVSGWHFAGDRSENYHFDSFHSDREQNYQTGLIFTPAKFGICEGICPFHTKQKGKTSMDKIKKAIDMTPEELEQWLDTLKSDHTTAPLPYLTADPYAKREPQSERHRQSTVVIDENGVRRVKNESAYWIPEITISEKIGNTFYTVTGTYEGETSFVRKLERIMARKFAREMEAGSDTFTNL